MSVEDAKLKQKLQLQEIDARLVNWGNWSRHDGSRLGLPTKSTFVASSRWGPMLAELDAIHIEDVISTLHLSGYKQPMFHNYILKVEYLFRDDDRQPPVSVRAAYVRKKYNMPCAESTYYKHLSAAKTSVYIWSDKIKTA